MRNTNRIKKTDFHPLLRIFVYVMVAIFTVLALYPLYWLFISSLKTNTEFQLNITGWPWNPTFQNYPTAWRLAQFDTLFVNSIFFTTLSTLLVILFSMMAGFAFAKIPSKATPFLHGSFVIGILLTLQSIMVPLSCGGGMDCIPGWVAILCGHGNCYGIYSVQSL